MPLLKSSTEVLENEFLRIEVQANGAELCSILDKRTNSQLLWQASSEFWGRHAPVLFPIVGKLKNNQYEYEGKVYSMNQHGFARDKVFQLESRTNARLVYRLDSDNESEAVYPFTFSLFVCYELIQETIHQTYRVENRGDGEMLFSIGAHPAFALDQAFSAYSLSFKEKEPNLKRTTLQDGLLHQHEALTLKNDLILDLNYSLFAEDALVFESLRSDEITINHSNQKVLTIKFAGFPFFGIWTKSGAPFLCLEPWHGVADEVTISGKLSEKKGMIALQENESKEASFSMIFH